MLTMADKGGRGIWTPLFLADIICEQHLLLVHSKSEPVLKFPHCLERYCHFKWEFLKWVNFTYDMIRAKH